MAPTPAENLIELWPTLKVEEKLAYYEQAIVRTRVKEENPWPVMATMPTNFTVFDPASRPTSAEIYKQHCIDSPEYAQALKEYQDLVLAYYRLAGFPHYKMLPNQINAKFSSLLNYVNDPKREPLIRKTPVTDEKGQVTYENLIYQSMHGLSLAWLYFPHAWSVQCGKMRTAMEIFEDPVLFEKALVKRMKFGTYISDSGIRKGLRSYSGSQAVSNFRPSAAAAIYEELLPPCGGVTWDMSSGFGGRLLGAMSCHRVLKYIGTDPATKTMEGLHAMKKELEDDLIEDRTAIKGLLYQLDNNRPKIEIVLLKQGSEDPLPVPDESVDLCFTSPPYFDTEKYSNEETQSYIKYGRKTQKESQEAWLYGFMKDTLANCHRVLKPEGYLAVNIADVATYPNLNDEFVKMAEDNGWKEVKEKRMYLLLSKMMGTRGDDDRIRNTRCQRIAEANDAELLTLAKRLKVSQKTLTRLSSDQIKETLILQVNDTTKHKERKNFKKEPVFVFRKA
jgi:hypothetical protein